MMPKNKAVKLDFSTLLGLVKVVDPMGAAAAVMDPIGAVLLNPLTNKIEQVTELGPIELGSKPKKSRKRSRMLRTNAEWFTANSKGK